MMGVKGMMLLLPVVPASGFYTSVVKVHKNIPATKNHNYYFDDAERYINSSVASPKSSLLCQKHSEELLKLY